MRRLLVAPLLLAALAALALDPPPADAQGVKPTEEAFTTADGVRLKGLFHKSPTGGKQGDAVVVLLYPPGPEKTMLKGNWDSLVDALNTEGFHVFRFDWRGHGGSTDIVDPLGDNTNIGGVRYTGFWVNGITGGLNQQWVKGFQAKGGKNEIRVKGDIRGPGYFPVYVNDLAAVRLHLDQKNDQGDVNTSSLYVIGAGDTASLGMMWLASEWQRPAVAPMLPQGLQYKSTPFRGIPIVADPPAGADVAGAVWLSAGRPTVVSEYQLKTWAISSVKLRDNNKMLFMYGKTDGPAKTAADVFLDRVLVANGNKGLGLAPIEQTTRWEFAGTKLNGIDLLGQKDVNAEAKVIEYLKARQKDRVSMIRKTRNYVTPYYVDVNYFMNLRP